MQRSARFTGICHQTCTEQVMEPQTLCNGSQAVYKLIHCSFKHLSFNSRFIVRFRSLNYYHADKSHEKVVHGKHNQVEARISEVAQQVKVLAMPA